MSRLLRLALVAATVFCCMACLLFLPCIQQVRDGEGWIDSANNLQAIGRALQNYHEVYGHLPPATFRGKNRKPLYSWRVLLLPFIEQDYLYKQFHLDEPWDSPHNKPLLQKMPWYYSDRRSLSDRTHYQVFIGPGTAFEREGLTWKDFPDGLASTLLVVEAREPVPWTKPVDLVYHPDKPLPTLGGVFAKPVHLWCYEIGRNPGFNAVFADASHRFIRSNTDEGAIRGLITRNGGEEVDRWR